MYMITFSKTNPKIKMKHPSIGIVIPTLNAGKLLSTCLPPILASSLKPRILIVDSASNDDTLAIASKFSIETVSIERKDFNHGLTREMARKKLNTDIVIMMTPDAIATNAKVLEVLIKPIVEGHAAIAYARQIPHDGAKFFEAFPRHFNYPEVSQLRGIEDLSKYGVYTFFCSDSFAAYSNKALDEIGGFKMVLLGEDTVAAAELLKKGYKIAYVAEAEVKHSHGYTLKQEFRRYFDTGIARKEYQKLIACKKETEMKRGSTFAKEMIKRLSKENLALIPYAFIQTFVKLLGFQIGKACMNGPIWLKQKLSCQPSYWTSSAYLKSQREKIL
jgi:rhamnosyltransferase